MQCLDCQAPCKNCSTSPTKCTSCYNNTYWLGGTCLSSCPGNGLYVANQDSWACQSCSNNCSTCLITRDTCTSCSSGYKLNKIDNTCIKACPVGTAEDSNGVCNICSANCKTCSGTADTCTSCYGSQLLSGGQCVGSCPTGQTQSGSSCLNCNTECTSCINGDPSYCTSCKSGFYNYQYSQCVKTCPSPYVGRGEYCIDPNLRCDFGYSISENGTVCVLSAYACKVGYRLNDALRKCVPVPGFYFPFPFLLFSIFLTVALALYLRLKQHLKSTNMVQCAICIWSALEPLLYLIQFILAAAFEHTAVLVLTLFALLLFYSLNVYMLKVAIKRRFEKDQVLQHWMAEFPQVYKRILGLSLYHNQKLLRLMTCSLAGQTRFQATFDDITMNYLKPQLRATIINALSSYLLIVVADITCFATVEWGYQLLITCIESLIFVGVLITLQIIDYFQMKRLHMRSHEYYKVNARSIDMGTVRGNFEDSLTPGGSGTPQGEDSVAQLKQKSKERRALLEKITADLEQMDKNKNNYDDLEHFLLRQEFGHQDGPKAKLVAEEEGEYQQVAEGYEDIEDLLETQKLLKQSRNVNLIPNQSTLNHLAENRENMIDNQSREDEVWDRCISEREEDYYGDPEALDQARELFSQINAEIVRQRLERQRLQEIMDYNARMAEGEGNEDMKIHLNKPQFNLEQVLGQFQRDQDGNYLIIKNKEGQLVDQVGRPVNRRGYIIDEEGNIITKQGEFVLQKELIDKGDDIPIKIFKKLFLPIDSDGLSYTSRSNKGVSAYISKSDKTVVSQHSGGLSNALPLEMEEGLDQDHTTYMNGRRGGRGQKSMKSIGIDPASSQTSILHNHPDLRINSDGEPYHLDIQFGDSEHFRSRKRLPNKKKKYKRLNTAHPRRNEGVKTNTTKQIGGGVKRNIKSKPQSSLNVRNQSQDLRSQMSTRTQRFNDLAGSRDAAIRYKSTQLPIRVSTGRSKSLKSIASNHLNARATHNLSFNSNHIGKLNNNSQDYTEELLNQSYQVNMFNPANSSHPNRFRESGTVTLKQQSLASNLSKKRRHQSSVNASDQPERASMGSVDRRRRRSKKQRQSQDTISEADSDQIINRAIKPKIPKQLKKPSKKANKGPSVQQDPEMFSINISVPAGNQGARKSRERLTQQPKRPKKAHRDPQESSKENGPVCPFNIIDIFDKNRAKLSSVPYNSTHDPITHQLNKLLKREKQQIEELRRQAFENQTTAKKNNVSQQQEEMLPIHSYKPGETRQRIDDSRGTHTLRSQPQAQNEWNNTQPFQSKAQNQHIQDLDFDQLMSTMGQQHQTQQNQFNETAQTQDMRKSSGHANYSAISDNQTTIKKNALNGGQIGSLKRPFTSNQNTINESTLVSPAGNSTQARIAFNQSGRLIMNQSLGDGQRQQKIPHGPSKNVSNQSLNIHPQRPLQNPNPQSNNYFKGSSNSLNSSLNNPFLRESIQEPSQPNNRLMEEAQDLIDQLGGLQSRPGTQGNQRTRKPKGYTGMPNNLTIDEESQGSGFGARGDMKGQFHPSVISPSLLSAQSITEINFLNKVHEKIGARYAKPNMGSLDYTNVDAQTDKFSTLNNSRPAFQAYANQNVPSIGLPPKSNIFSQRKQSAMGSNANARLQNVRDIYSQNVRAPSTTAGVQPKSQLRGITAYDQNIDQVAAKPGQSSSHGFGGGGTSFAMINTTSNKAKPKQMLFNNQSEDELDVGDPYKTLNKIFKQK